MAGKKRTTQGLWKNRDGQSIVLVAIMVLSFLMFFTFTLNTGLLIHAKISVQAAADSAAYAGAATQGRLLNAISFLNYDMRRQYKKFVFRNFFLGSLGSPNFPASSTGATTGIYDFPKLDFTNGNTPTPLAMRVPLICVPLLAPGIQSDRCPQLNMRNTTRDLTNALGTAPGGGSAILQTVMNFQNQVANLMQKTCMGQGKINEVVAQSWLFKAENDEAIVEQMVDAWFQGQPNANQQKDGVANLLKGLVRGLGIYPRNILNLMRINTLVDFINTPHQTVNLETVEAFERDTTKAETLERTILAFKSALSNLNSSVFDPASMTLEELQSDNLMQVEKVQVDNLDVIYQATEVNPTAVENSNSPTFCQSFPMTIKISGLPVGVRLKPIAGRKVVYAVKVKAFIKPRGLLFAPWNGDLELSAVAGAKPFGSRIGPSTLRASELQEAVDTTGVKINNQSLCLNDLTQTCSVPNAPLGAGRSFRNAEVLQEFKAMAGGDTITVPGVLKAQYHAMAPNAPEVGTYGILPPPPTTDPSVMKWQFIPYFDGKGIPPGITFKPPIPIYRFYAPISRAGRDAAGEAKSLLKFIKDLPSNPNLGFNSQALHALAEESIVRYINTALTAANNSENQESLTFAAIELPMYNLNAPTLPKLWLTRAREVLTSWGPSHVRSGPNSYTYSPRFGYSVKLVALRELLSEGVPDMDSELESIPH